MDLAAKKDQIINGLRAGMSLADMYILTELDPIDMERLDNDAFFQAECKAAPKLLEYDLLNNLKKIIGVQAIDGKESATVWLLEKLNPRWTGKTDSSKAGVVNINFGAVDIDKEPTVSIYNPETIPDTGKE